MTHAQISNTSDTMKHGESWQMLGLAPRNLLTPAPLQLPQVTLKPFYSLLDLTWQ